MQRAVYILVGILVLSLAAFGLAETTMALGHRSVVTDDRSVRPLTQPKPSPSASPSPSAAPTATPTPASTPTPVLMPAAPTATTISFVHMRSGASTATPIVLDLNGGAVVTLGAYSDSQWQQVNYNGQNGYVFKAYLRY
jgi:uncharacterized protein YgiM (DUF1202 family)